MEKQLILDKDLESQEEEDKQIQIDKKVILYENDLQIKNKKMWFMISGEWLFQWKCFISNKVSNSINIS
jgi:hypothetical protein